MCQEMVLSVVAVSGQRKHVVHKDELRVTGGSDTAWRQIRAWRKECLLVGVTPKSAIIKTSGGEYVGRWDND